MRDRLPETIHVSVFEINCREIKEFFSEKYQTLTKNLIDMIAKKAKSDSQTLFSTFQQM